MVLVLLRSPKFLLRLQATSYPLLASISSFRIKEQAVYFKQIVTHYKHSTRKELGPKQICKPVWQTLNSLASCPYLERIA